MKVLTAARMREVDRRTVELGIPGVVLMENAAHRVMEFLVERFAPLAAHRIVVLCGKGNNGGDGLAIARQLHTRIRPRSLDVVLLADPAELKGDAAENFRMLGACGCPVRRALEPAMQTASLVIDALLGTGVKGAASGAMLAAIREINGGFPLAQVVAVDIPSGMASDAGEAAGEVARADATVTFTALKVAHAMPPNCDRMGEALQRRVAGGDRAGALRCAARAASARRPQRNVRACAGGGRFARQSRRGGHGRNGGVARRRGAGDGGLARARHADHRPHPGADDRTARRK
jgi:NAD(P)H-hydrate epimerase